MNFDVITLGSATVDVFASSESQLIKLVSSHSEEDFIAFRSGDKILVSDLKITTGGGGTNTAVSFSRLGLRTGFCGAIGKDIYAKQILEELESENITFLGTQLGKSGYSVIFDSVEHDRVILSFKGSNNNLSFDAIKSTIQNSKTKWVYSSSVLDESFSCAVATCTHLKKQGSKIAWNPSLYQTKLGSRVLQPLLSLLDVLIMNKEEAFALLNDSNNNNNNKTIENLLVELQKHTSANHIIITDGAQGAYCSYNNKLYTITPSPHVQVVETTGAGDAFASGFVSGLIKNYSCEDALTLGMLNAEHVICAQGAKTNLLHAQSSHKLIPTFTGSIHSKTILNNSNISSDKEINEEKYTQKIIEKTTQTNNKENTNKSIVAKKAQKQERKLEKNIEYIHHKKLVDMRTTDKPFIFSNGKKAYSLDELYDALRTLSKEVFMFHVHDNENHFATWINDCFNLPTLAQLVAKEKTKIGIQLALQTYLGEK